jgi:peptidoglycan glycosyltransferase
VSAPIRRLFALVLVLFAVLVAFTSRWTVFEAQGLKENPSNRRELLVAQRTDRGDILARDGTVLARSVPAGGGTYQRRYPTGALFGHPVGYWYVNIGDSGLEQARNDALLGREDTLEGLLALLGERPDQGDAVRTSLVPAAQRRAVELLSGRRGAVVAMEPSTGRILTMASTPGYDPNQVDEPRRFRALNLDGTGSPLLDRATQARYAPGSTFKVVTAAAALDSGRYTPESPVDGSAPATISGVPLNNDGGASYGTISLRTALTQSVNTAWARVALTLGRQTMTRYMRRFGFYETPRLDYPEAQMVRSGVLVGGRLVPPTSRLVDLGRMAIGEGQLKVTPLQMAQVAATVANGGVLMRPHLTDRIVDPDGRTVRRIEPERVRRAMSPEAARQLGSMMSDVVGEGTGTAAQLSGISVAGKTGTAELTGGGLRNQVWFIGFAPVSKPRVAIAVTIEDQPCCGGTVAAPVAREVLQELL